MNKIIKLISLIIILQIVICSYSNVLAEDDNGYLKIFRINNEGIIPYFDKTIKEYYLNVGSDVNKIEITAIPENKNMNVKILNNENLNSGLNTIETIIYDEQKNKIGEYYIYVTKTDNEDMANANLENLAIEGVDLAPEFETYKTKYDVSVANDMERLNILAVPENINSKVNIEGANNIQIGDNVVIIKVVAENGYTFRNYIINVHRRNMEEENQVYEEKEQQIKKLNSLLQNNKNEVVIKKQSSEIKINRNYEEIRKFMLIAGIIVMIIIAWKITNIYKKSE